MTVILRKLTRKSLLTFGKYHDFRVGDLINTGKHKYLRWVYFNNSMITFFEDILDEIKIPEAYRIKKPGKSFKEYGKLERLIWKGMSELDHMKYLSRRKRVNKGTKYTQDQSKRVQISKARLQTINHGKRY